MNQIVKHGSGFALEPRSIGEAMEMAAMLSRSGMVPACYKGKAEDTLVAMMMGRELGLNPIQSLQNIAVINGRPSIYGDALVALVQNHPSFGGLQESFDDSTMTASCTVWRKGGEHHTQTFSKKDAETAKLWGKAGPWTQYPKRMLQMRARGFAVRSQFADALAGLITREEAEDMPVERDITPVSAALPSAEYITDEQAADIKRRLEATGSDVQKFCQAMTIPNVDAMPADRYAVADAMLTRKANKIAAEVTNASD